MSTTILVPAHELYNAVANAAHFVTRDKRDLSALGGINFRTDGTGTLIVEATDRYVAAAIHVHANKTETEISRSIAYDEVKNLVAILKIWGTQKPLVKSARACLLVKMNFGDDDLQISLVPHWAWGQIEEPAAIFEYSVSPFPAIKGIFRQEYPRNEEPACFDMNTLRAFAKVKDLRMISADARDTKLTIATNEASTGLVRIGDWFVGALIGKRDCVSGPVPMLESDLGFEESLEAAARA